MEYEVNGICCPLCDKGKYVWHGCAAPHGGPPGLKRVGLCRPTPSPERSDPRLNAARGHVLHVLPSVSHTYLPVYLCNYE